MLLQKNKWCTALVIAFLLSTSIKAQQNDEKCVEKGEFIIDAYYGFPYVMGQIIKDNKSSYATNEKVVNYNHVGGKFEYMINDMIGLGVDYTYAKVTNNFNASYYTTNSNGQQILLVGNFNESLIKQRLLAKMNLHFATTKSLDPYAVGGIGYKETSWKSNDPNFSGDLSFFNVFPIAFRVGAGLHWYFSKNFGLGIEAGIGGPIMQVGLSAKI